MKIATLVVMQMTDNIGEYLPIEKHEFEYDGVVELCDRAASSAAKQAGAQAATTESQAGSNATAEHATLDPFYTKELNAEHGFDPTQTNEMLTYALGGSGGATGALNGQAELEAARTRNPSGFTKSLDEVSRNQSKAAAGASEGIAAQDVMGAKQLNQEGAAGLQGLEGTDTNAMLGAMGQRTADINTQIEAGKSGWLQNMNSTIESLGKANPFSLQKQI